MKLVLASPSPCTKDYLGVEGCSVHMDLESAVNWVQLEGDTPDEWYFFDIEVGEHISFEMKAVRMEVPMRKK